MINRDAFAQKLKEKIDLWSADLAKLEVKADQVTAETRLKYQQQIEDLQARRRDLEEKMVQLRGASEGALEDLKTGMEIAWASMSEALSSALHRFK